MAIVVIFLDADTLERICKFLSFFWEYGILSVDFSRATKFYLLSAVLFLPGALSMIIKPIREFSLLVTFLALGGCVQSGVQTGGGGTMISGSSGGATSINANKSLARCTAPLGTLAVSDGRYGGSSSVTTVDPLIRLAVQQSNCFVITSIGNARTNSMLNQIIDQQRNSGEYRAGSKQETGQRVAADYFLDPQVIINNETTSGSNASLGGGLLGIAGSVAGIPQLGAVAGAVSGAMETKSTAVTLTLTDIRSTVQVAVSEGSATTNNLSASMGGWGGILGAGGLGAGGVGMGAFTNTPEGQATAAAFFDAYNNMVQSLKNYKAQDVKGGMGQGGQLKVN
jgi:hypothetical protein